MRKTRSRGTKRHVKRHTRRRGGENSPNPASGAPTKVNKKPTINLNKLPSKNIHPLGQLPGTPGSRNYNSFFPPENTEGFAFPNRTAAPNARIKNIKKRAEEIKAERKRVNKEIEKEKEREEEKKDLERGLIALEKELAKLIISARAAQMRGDTNAETSIQEYIDTIKADISHTKDLISELESNNEEDY